MQMPFMFYVLLLPGAFFAPIFHEYVKASVSAALGDVTIKKQGLHKFSLKKFFEPIGFFFMMYFNLGWGQPAQVSPLYYKDRRKGILLTFLVPIAANIMLGLLVLLIWGAVRPGLAIWSAQQALAGSGVPNLVLSYIHIGIVLFAQCNIGLALFNLVPINPLAGSKLLPLFLSPETAVRMNYYEKPLQIIMVIMLMFGLLQALIFPVRDLIIGLVGF